MRALQRITWGFGWIVLLTGVLLQAVVRDRFESLSLLFYALPKPCLVLLAFILLVWPRISRRARIFAGGAFLLIGGWWLAVAWGNGAGQGSSSVTGGEEVKVLFWNLNRPAGIQRDMVDLVKESQPHIAAFVEPGQRAGDFCADYEKLLPGYKVEFMPRGILWLSRVPSKFRERGKLDAMGAFARFDVTGLGPPFSMVVGDVYAQPFRSRGYQLREVLGHAQGRADAVIAGDFNTPGESVFFDEYRKQYRDVFETAGHGFRETWPYGVPLLSLDHMWVGAAWQIVEMHTVQRGSSDHKAVLATLRRKRPAS